MKSGAKYIEKQPTDYTNILEKVEVLSVKKYFENGRNISYVYHINRNIGYPARNGGYLDGLIGCTKLRTFKARFVEVTSFNFIRYIQEYNELIEEFGKKRVKSLCPSVESYIHSRTFGNYSLEATKQTLKA